MPKTPVFIIGINPRSGTNYLYQLLALHPDCVHSKHYGEDFFLFGADKYLEFYEKVTRFWNPAWKNDKAVFKRSLEMGLLNYLNPGGSPARYMVTKTPSAANAKLFTEVFSEGYMIIITRKGQDLVESFMKTFNSRFEDAVRGWKRGAVSIHDVINDKAIMDSGRVLMIKYEDLYQHNEEVMKKILTFLKLDLSTFDFSKSQNFDVIGSSTFKGNSEKVTWNPIPKDSTFNPLGRFSHWGRFKHYRFNWMAGKYAKEFGYELYYDSKDPLYFLYNITLSTYDFFHRSIRRVYIILKALGKSKSEWNKAMEIRVG